MVRSVHSLLSGLLLLALAPAPHVGSRDLAPAGRTRTYYVAADEVSWDYVPGQRDEIAGRPFADSAFFAKGAPRVVSTTYRKQLFREYTDSAFRTLRPRPPEWEHLGFLGPIMHAEVGDTIRVIFRNNGHRPFSMHPHGVFYTKSSEGSPYNDGTARGDGTGGGTGGAAPGATHVYILAGAVASRTGSNGWQLGHVDVSLARGRGPRHQLRTPRGDDHYRARHGAAGQLAEECRSRDRDDLCAGARRRQLAGGREPRTGRFTGQQPSDRQSLRAPELLSVVREVHDQRVHPRQHAVAGALRSAAGNGCAGTSCRRPMTSTCMPRIGTGIRRSSPGCGRT